MTARHAVAALLLAVAVCLLLWWVLGPTAATGGAVVVGAGAEAARRLREQRRQDIQASADEEVRGLPSLQRTLEQHDANDAARAARQATEEQATRDRHARTPTGEKLAAWRRDREG